MSDKSADLPMRVDLLRAKERFDEANNAFRKAALNHTGTTWLPEDFLLEESGADSQREAMVKRWCHIYKQHDGDEPRQEPPTGLLCASDNLIALAAALNSTKDELKNIVVALRRALKPDQFRAQLKGVGMLDYDLTRTYQNVQIIEHPLHVISWSWIVGSSKVKPVTVKELNESMEGYALSDAARATVKLALTTYAESTELAQVKIAALQLRANTQRFVNGELDRKLIVTSGPLLLRQDSLPPTRMWRGKPTQASDGSYIKPVRIPRSDRVLGQELICKLGGYSIYEYLQKPKTNKRHKKAS